ncbi:MAG: radical SAM peptide maturase [Bacteroidetes bacterium]|nr:radical SAM peptide maturase [Bacteroidota bacterium]
MKENNYFDDITSNSRYKFIEEQLIHIKKNNSITFEITEKCNLSCKYCTYGELYNHYKKRDFKDINFKIIKNTIDNYIDKDSKELSVSFYGGEPLLNFEQVTKTIDYINKKFKNNIKISYSITTNGILIHKYIDFLKENNFDILISLDGNIEDNYLRTFPNGENSFKSIYNNICYIKTKYPEYFESNITFNSVLHSKSNQSGIFNFFKREFNKIPLISEISSTGLVKEKQKDFKTIYKNLQQNNKKINSDNIELFKKKYCQFNYESIDQFIYGDNNEKIIPTGTCAPLSRGIFVTADGTILPCESIPHCYKLGDVDDKLFNLNYKSIAESFNKYLSDAIKTCNRCYYYLICGKCIFNMGIDSGKIKCDSFKNYQQFKNYIKESIEIAEVQAKEHSI